MKFGDSIAAKTNPSSFPLLSMWDESRLLGPFDLFVVFFFSVEPPLSSALRFP